LETTHNMASFSLALVAICFLALTAFASAGCVLSDTAAWTVGNVGSLSYQVGACGNPTFRLQQGIEYTWNVDATGHPFWIKTAAGTGTSNALPFVTNNGAEVGAVKFTPTAFNVGNTYFYSCENHAGMTGEIVVVNSVGGLRSLLGVALVAISILATLF